MPLADVRSGMRCTGLSVIRGTEIASFDVEVIDVLAAEPPLSGPRILVRVSGPAVDATGIGPGFSGSPVLCPDGTGVARNAGAISEGIGEYGNRVVLATPIEEILADRPPTPAGASRRPALARRARPLATPLTASGLSPLARRLLEKAARRGGRTVLAAPGGPLGGYPPQELRPGSAVAASFVSGDIAMGSVGTVTYRDGNSVWAFGHPLEGAGRRSLFLQDAYVFSVIGNPLGIPELGMGTYKLTTSGGHDLGAITTDSSAAISGTIGAGPASVPLGLTARAGGRTTSLDMQLADERPHGLGLGLSVVAPLAGATAIDRLMRSFEPATISMCARFRLERRKRPLGWCKTYFGADSAFFDLSDAGLLVESFDTPVLPLRAIDVSMRIEQGVAQDVLVKARGPQRVRRGRRVPVRLTLQRRRGGRRTITVRVPVPRSLRPGPRMLVLEGDGGELGFEEQLADALGGGISFEVVFGEELAPPRTVRQLERRLDRFGRPSGIRARFGRRGGRLVRRSRGASFEGRVRIPVVVRRR
jgi:hypothetical protein